jgi:plasmid stabilization system protein ParE
MNVHWTAAALANLRAIEATIGQHSERYARGMVERIFARTAALADLPLLGAVVPEYGEEDLRELFEHPYRIVYRVLTDQLDVVAIVHAARRMPRGL